MKNLLIKLRDFGRSHVAVVFVALTAILLAVLLCSCSPQKQLANLLANHPELHADTSVVLQTMHVLRADSASIEFTLADISGRCRPDTGELGQCTNSFMNAQQNLTVSTRNGATATISATGHCIDPWKDKYKLSLNTPADTIYIRDTVPVPVYFTRTKVETQIVYQMTRWQRVFYTIGVVSSLLLVLCVILRFVSIFTGFKLPL